MREGKTSVNEMKADFPGTAFPCFLVVVLGETLSWKIIGTLVKIRIAQGGGGGRPTVTVPLGGS